VLGLIAIILLDHIFITVTDLGRSIAFYERALKPLGITGHALSTITGPVPTVYDFQQVQTQTT